MKKIVLSLMFILSSLVSKDTFIEKLIPKGYTFTKSQGDLNHDGKEEILLNLENYEQNKNKLIILELKNKEYQILFESDTVLSYPSNNGKGYMIQSISSNIKNNYLVINTYTYSGKLIIRDYYFKQSKNKFFLDKFVEQINSKCNNEVLVNRYIAKNIKPILYLKNFSIDNFFKIYYPSKKFQKTLLKVIDQQFNESYNKLLKLYRNNFELFKKEIEELIVYDERTGKVCLPEYYLDKYLYFKDNKISKSNDIAFFFDRAGYHKEAIYLLEKIIKKFPKRTVAYYNLGDAYWALGDKKKAVASYKIYIEQMKAKGKEKRIPQKVKDRAKGEN